ncbi:pyrrolo-quinoline quinone [Herbaspirillum rubrisubalbicans]|uniref:Outer membrane protein assembly factor BamB n=2 Tax=Herbaspirillum rubrisubalbicans TaxID=80842 RepID=A0ABX9C3H1_9BURK|nr:outer membrane protein assembly factor BamB [Herbaspirillum rubrisubalbicans]QJQ01807.1 outer membrane protein assembly factor BamB [Herbaspirillum rubrisubalbicans Os34]RAM64907.1 pyrrolo-quinoline quinone [Herbaspirillum rubrisubalbicans]RAN48130.1 pyrrolo-quinoline quinone [Herbaspirillum rubrisubalbicans]
MRSVTATAAQATSFARSRRAGKLALNMAAIAAVVALSGCSLFSSKKDPNPPAPLVEFTQKMRAQAAWTVAVGKAGSYQFSPAFASGSVFAAANDGTVVRINAQNGQTLWRSRAEGDLTAGVGTDGSTVVVVGEKGRIQAFDAASGKPTWTAQAPSEVLSAPAVGEGLVVIRSIDNRVTAYDADSGSQRWMVQRNLPSLTLRNAPGIAIGAQTAFVALPGGRLSALALNNGGPRWEIPVGDPRGTTELERISDVSGMPALGASDICAASYQGRIGCFDLLNGNVRWLKEFSSDVGVNLDDAYVYAADVGGTVTEFARDTGAVIWRNDRLKNRVLSAPIAIGKAVAVGDFQGYIHFLSREDGAFVARLATDGSAIQAPPVSTGSSVVFQTKSGTVVAVAAE